MLEILLGLSTSPMLTLPPWPGLAKVQRKKTCFVPVYWSGPKVSHLAGTRDVGATTVNVLLNWYNNSDEIYRLIPLSLSTIQDIEKTSNTPGDRGFGLADSAIQSTWLVLVQSKKKNEVTARVALVKAAVTVFTLLEDHQLLGGVDVWKLWLLRAQALNTNYILLYSWQCVTFLLRPFCTHFAHSKFSMLRPFWNCFNISKLCKHFEIVQTFWNYVKIIKLSQKFGIGSNKIE